MRRTLAHFSTLTFVALWCGAFSEIDGSNVRCGTSQVATPIAIQSATQIATHAFQLSVKAEVGLEIVARVRGGSWAKRGAEAAALIVNIDDAYSSDLILWAGDEQFTYRAHLGRLSPGKHTASIRLNKLQSASQLLQNSSLEIVSLRTVSVAAPRFESTTADADFAHALALARSPILFARANTIGHFTDVPLLMYYEIFAESKTAGETGLRVRYTVIFSHEDGGTPTAALMARWGRTTDIEWVYEFVWRDGQVTEESFQGVGHETKTFGGNRTNGDHPLLAVASDNNNFSDLACTAVRYALLPVRARLANSSRERVMDDAPWTYRIMAEELARERRIGDSSVDVNRIADPRAYLYTEVYAEQQGASLSLEARLTGDTRTYLSDAGDARLRVDRSGYFRIATPLSPNFSPANLDTITVRCHNTPKQSDNRICDKVKLSKVFVLDRNFVPRELRIAGRSLLRLRPGEAGTFRVKF